MTEADGAPAASIFSPAPAAIAPAAPPSPAATDVAAAAPPTAAPVAAAPSGLLAYVALVAMPDLKIRRGDVVRAPANRFDANAVRAATAAEVSLAEPGVITLEG